MSFCISCRVAQESLDHVLGRAEVGFDRIDGSHYSLFLLGPLLTLAPTGRWGHWLGTDHGDPLAIGLNDQNGTFRLRQRHGFLLVESLHINSVLLDTCFQSQFGDGEAQYPFKHLAALVIRFVGDTVLGPITQQVRVAAWGQTQLSIHRANTFLSRCMKVVSLKSQLAKDRKVRPLSLVVILQLGPIGRIDGFTGANSRSMNEE